MADDPLGPYKFRHGNGTTLLIACGALGRKVVDLVERNGWRRLDVTCVAARYHHTRISFPRPCARRSGAIAIATSGYS